MHRNVTAIYRTHSVADEVRREVEALGISGRHVHVLHPPGEHGHDRGHHDRDYATELDNLDLPDDDRHTYENALKRGDHVVSVRVNENDEAHMSRVTDIMRHPDAHDFNTLDNDFRDVPRSGHSAGHDRAKGRRDTDYDYGGTTLRGYTYDDPYVPPRMHV